MASAQIIRLFIFSDAVSTGIGFITTVNGRDIVPLEVFCNVIEYVFGTIFENYKLLSNLLK